MKPNDSFRGITILCIVIITKKLNIKIYKKRIYNFIMTTNMQKEIDKLIDLYFNQQKILYEHLFDSYHQFVREIIPFSLEQEQNYFYDNVDKEHIYLHGFKCIKIRIKPSTFENDNEIKFPSDARRNHLNYFATVVADVQQFVEKVDTLTGEKTIKLIGDVEKETPVANIPIMVKSKYCSTHIKQDLKAECKFDPGGYFIVNGAEKVVMSMEKMVDNKILVFSKKDTSFDGGMIYTAQINSRRNDWSDNLQILTIKNRKDGVLTVTTSSQLVDIPIFILMKALGIEADQDIISHITYDLEDTKMLNLIRPSVAFSMDEKGETVKTKEEAIEFLITKLKRNKRISQSDEEVAKIQKKMYLEKILRQDLLPHLGEDMNKKIAFLGFMTNRLLNTMLGRTDTDDRDALHNKRIEPPGILLGQLFRQNWKKMLNEIGKLFKKKNQSDENPINIVNQIKPSTIEQGLKTALATGIWGMNKTKKGVAQSLQRLSWIQGISALRRVLSPSMDETTAKVTSIRHVNTNQCQMLCITGDTEILLSNRMDSKMIKDIVDGDAITTVNINELKEEPSQIYNKFGRMSDKLLEIRTINGRTIKATPEHPFLVNINGKSIWKNAGELTVDDKLVIRHMEKLITPDKDTIVIINDVLEHYKMELLEGGYYDRPISQNRLISLVRLIGSINTDGHLGTNISKENNNMYYQAEFHVGEECDAYQVAGDIANLGFGNPMIRRVTHKFEDKTNNRTTNYTTWCVTKNGAFAYLLSLLGGFVGKKTEMSRTIPTWILNANKLIKREFLSAFQGGDGSKLVYQLNKTSKAFKIAIGPTGQTTIDKFVDDTTKYLTQISDLFNEFDIKTSVHIRDLKIEGKKTVELVFENTTENILKYADYIGYRYCEEKRRKSVPVIEHLKIRQEYYNVTKSKYDKVLEMIKNNDTRKNISKECDVSASRVSRLMSIINKTDTMPEPRFSCPNFYDEFIKDNIMDNGNVSVQIKQIREIPNEMVYDFTTYSDNHSMLASSFWTHNCPSETPEGQKIGIVKSLAMMSLITSQNATQGDVLRSLLKQNKHIKHPYDVDPLTMRTLVKIMINGDWYGVCKISSAQEIYENLKKKRRDNVIDKMTSILFDYRNKEIRIHYDGGRLIRPLLIVNNNTLGLDKEIITDVNTEYNMNDKTKSWKKIMSKYPNLIEYEDIESLNYLLVAENKNKLDESIEASQRKVEYTDTTKINRYGDYRFMKYTHCDFHSWVMLGTVVANIPFSNHNYATRNIIHFSQAKQSIGVYLSSYKDRMDISQVLYHPQLPIVTTQGMKYNGCMDLPYGENAIVAVASYNGYNQEDSLIFNQSSIDRGIFRADTLKKYHSEIMKNPSTSQDDIFNKPDRNKVTGMKQGNYDKLNDKGFVPEETIIDNEDVIIGKISPIQPTGNNNKVYKDSSEIFKTNVEGVIDRVHTGIYNAEGYEMYNVRVRMERKPMSGDKFTTRHGQKGTVGITYAQRDMPFTESGIVPDLILNPHGYPSRMSVGHFIECIAAKEAAETGHFVDGTPFNNYNMKQLPEALQKLGYSPHGTETMYCGLTGRKMDVEIFIGPVYNVRLKHMVLDKVHGRARGPRQALTRQPLEGRSRDGGLKIGEMEKDAMVAHGMSQFIKERMMETSDITKVYVCDECGMFASKVIDKEYYKCKGCQNTSRISAVVIPYACKLLFQELTSVNILPRIRTERSIYSDES